MRPWHFVAASLAAWLAAGAGFAHGQQDNKAGVRPREAQAAKKDGKSQAAMPMAPAPKTGSMPKGGPTPTGKLGTEPESKGMLGTDPKPGDPRSRPPRPR